MEHISLKKCPHCGGSAAFRYNYNKWKRIHFVCVRCDICGAQGKIYEAGEDLDQPEAETACESAAAAWNMRYYEQEVSG